MPDLNEVYRLHADSLVIDSHNDAIVSLIRRGGLSLSAQPSPTLAAREGLVSLLRGPLQPEETLWNGQVSLSRLREGGIDCAFFAVDVTRAWKNHLAYAVDALGYFLTDLEELEGQVVVARSAAEIEGARREGRLAAVLVVENSDALEGSLNALQLLHHAGVRSLTLTHNPSSWAAAGNAESASGGGLTRFGERLVREMNRLGMLVDVSHIAERGFYDTLRVSSRPVIASHSCCAALCPHPRNLSDDQLRALAGAGGVVGITFVPSFLSEGWSYGAGAAEMLSRLLDHVDHAVRVAGIEHVGLGSDFDGGGTALPHAGEYPRLTEGLLARGYAPAEIRKILGENTLRLLRAALDR
ncbi:MAG: dipeptidase [Armatimonadota bacterium]